MNRKEFLKRSFATLGVIAVAPIMAACSKDEEVVPDDSGNTGTNETGDCVTTPSETAGPFPTKDPSSLERMDIRADREGIEMAVNITVLNKNNGCAVLEGAIVDIWHCDAAGNYSEYGNTGMQNTNYTGSTYHFLRGRQVTNSSGLVSFTSIFPGWYSGRAPHIHVHIYSASGRSLLVTQIAFPEDVTDTVYTTATDFYTRGKQDTSNARDNVFSDGVAEELATITGSISEGFELVHDITVEA